jgi:hypothetical protein
MRLKIDDYYNFFVFMSKKCIIPGVNSLFDQFNENDYFEDTAHIFSLDHYYYSIL